MSEPSVLERVARRIPLSEVDGDEVRREIDAGLLTVVPEYDRRDPCPYRLTEAGREALRERRVRR
ncbi:hypothetical protein Q0M94_28550 (plasmid) [Deinococcus radiomollis]|uniref:hypothetical protein n=1 Tax=Deinococcus radiomollis TaxID=468916 RepID=UPI003891AF63